MELVLRTDTVQCSMIILWTCTNERIMMILQRQLCRFRITPSIVVTRVEIETSENNNNSSAATDSQRPMAHRLFNKAVSTYAQ